MTLSDLERRDARGHIFRQIYLTTLEPLDVEGTLLWCQAHPHCKGGGAPVLSNFWGSLLFLRTSFDAELPNLMCEGLVFKGSALSQ